MHRVIIDVRDSEHYKKTMSLSAINITPMQLVTNAKQLINIPKNTEIIVYCNTGHRSEVAKTLLAAMGFNNVINGINQGHVISKLGGKYEKH